MNRSINLYRSELLPPPAKFSFIVMVQVILAFVLLLFAIAALDYWQLAKIETSAKSAVSERQQTEAELAAVKAKAAKMEVDPALKEKVESVEGELRRLQALLKMLGRDQSGRAPGFAPFLDGLARQMLPGMWVHEVRVDNGKDLAVVGCAMTPQLLPEFIKKLSSDAAFAEQHFEKFRLAKLDMPEVGVSAVGSNPPARDPGKVTETMSDCVRVSGSANVMDFELRSLTDLPENKPMVGGK